MFRVVEPSGVTWNGNIVDAALRVIGVSASKGISSGITLELFFDAGEQIGWQLEVVVRGGGGRVAPKAGMVEAGLYDAIVPPVKKFRSKRRNGNCSFVFPLNNIFAQRVVGGVYIRVSQLGVVLEIGLSKE